MATLATEARLLVINLHVEGLDGFRIVGHDNGALEVLLNQEALVLRGKVVAPLAWELKLLAVLDSLLQDAYTLGVGQVNEVGIEHTLQTLEQALVDHLVQEREVVFAVL